MQLTSNKLTNYYLNTLTLSHPEAGVKQQTSGPISETWHWGQEIEAAIVFLDDLTEIIHS